MMRKTRWGISGFALLGLCACTLPAGQEAANAPDLPQVSAPILSEDTVKPDAILFLPPANAPLPVEVTQSLREILEKRNRKNVLFTLEAWPSAEGSREISIEHARQAANRVRNKLVELGVRPYRIKISVRGEQEAHAPDEPLSTPKRQRVDLFLSVLAG
ncbi:MAG: hypothetical protein LBQ75_10595 [Zoogloeaceae bacterium]|jgi:hypothetical protein|nr:hypothetical protein [Zoogloeaceae bacterium]